MTEHERGWRVRRAEAADVPAIVGLVAELAEYEREPQAAQATVDDFRAALFCAHPLAHALVAEVSDDEGEWIVVGIAVWFVTFSTWKGRHGLWLEDLFVQPAHRRLGLGRALLAELSRICVDNGWPRFEWWVLDWNEPAHGFYRSIGAVPQDGWTTWHLDGGELAELAGSATDGPVDHTP